MISPVFCGIKHCGKSTLGRLIASASGVPFTDTDEELEKEFFRREGKKAVCRTIFREYGEEYFRKLEADVIRSLSDGKLRVIALGGGVASNPFLTVEELKRMGFWVYLDIAPQTAYDRISREGLPPFLQNAADPQKAFLELYNTRTPRFRELADMTYQVCSGLSPQEQAAELLKQLRENLEK
jgi:shikimate kinase